MIGYILLGILGIIVLLVLVVLVRTLLFRPKREKERIYEEVEYDGDRAIETLAELIKCKTVSYYDAKLEDDGEFEKLINKLPELFPEVIKNTELKRFEGRGLLFKWEGNEEGAPAVFMAHYDVVPVEEENWTKPAFEALIEDGIMYGRGSVDTKLTFNGIMSAGETLMKQGFKPQHDIYFAFSGGEEIAGIGAVKIVEYFKENNITPALVVDEGGAVVKDVFPGVKEDCGLIGIAEKGSCNIKLTNKSAGGHASSPAPHTPVGILSSACVKVEAKPFKYRFTDPVLKMFDTLGRRSTFVYRMIFANLWLFGPVLDMICKKSGGELNALVRTTVAFTQMQGSKAPNVVPPVASMIANVRLNPGDTVYSACDYFRDVINDQNVEIEALEGDNPSRISITDCDGYQFVKEAIEDTWRGCIVSPYLMVQCSDSRHYGPISDRVYRFSAADLLAEERKTIHGNDEHIRVDVIKRAVEFFIRVMKKC